MTFTTDEPTGILKISGTLDIDSANELRETLLDHVASQPEPQLDLSTAEACDAAALQVLFAAEKDAATLGKRLQIQSAPPCLAQTAAALGMVLPCSLQTPREEHFDAI